MASARTAAVVVPSPAVSLVLLATSRTICAPMFSQASSSSISLATVTPSLVTVGDPNFLSNTTLRPLGPRVAFTARLSFCIPLRSDWRAASSKMSCFAAILGRLEVELAGAERSGNSHRHLRFRFDDAGAHLGDAGDHFLRQGHGGGAADFGVGLGDEFVGLRLFGLELGADVFAHFNIRDVQGQDFESGVGVERLVEDGLGNEVGVFQNILVTGGRADRADDAFADARDDGLLGGPAHKAVQIAADSDQG